MNQPASITCPICGMTSYHPDDVLNGYCGYCHAFTASPPPPQEPAAEEAAREGPP